MTRASPDTRSAISGPEPVPVGVDADSPAEPSVRVRLDLSYDGTAFSGWARQPGRRTVQGVVEEALGRMLRLPPPPVTVAGRTDAGVHARGQVAHVDLPASSWHAAAERAVPRLARLLPADVRLRSAGCVTPEFDARFSALWRRYSYRVCDNLSGPEPLRRHEIAPHRRPLVLERMNAAAEQLTGEHDFAAFCRKRDGATTIRSLIRLDWARESPDVAVATVVADAFCHNMVRSLVGALLAVGDGRRQISWPAGVLKDRVRDPAVHVAPALGLCLEEVSYPPDADLAHRAASTRRMRGTAPAAVPRRCRGTGR
jgi:tRNA pseudouridine38-40 synthase